MFNVMVVDDMEYVRKEIRLLKTWKECPEFFISAEAENGYEALNKLKFQPVNLVIADIRMPVIDGISLVKKINEKNLAEFTVLLSDYADFNYARQGFVNGAFDYLIKPLNEKELSKLLSRVKQNIIKKRKDKEKIEQTTYKKIGVYYPTADISEILLYIENADERAIVLIKKMVHSFKVDLNKDLDKGEFLMKNVMQEIVSDTISKNEWINSFTNKSHLEILGAVKCSNWIELENNAVQVVEHLIFYIRKITYRNVSNFTVKKICKYVLSHIDGDLSVKGISDNLFISKTYLSDLFKEKTGIVLTEYLTMVKMERAKKLVLDGELRISEIAQKLGFKDIDYFTKIYKKFWGVTPRQTRSRS